MADDFKMLFLLWMLASQSMVSSHKPAPCLTGTVTDVQFWVTETGKLTSYVDEKFSLDLSAMLNPSLTHEDTLVAKVRQSNIYVKYMSLARNGLSRVPAIFDNLRDIEGWDLANTVQYLSFYGNRFVEVSAPGESFDEFFNATGATETRTALMHHGKTRAMWSASFQRAIFTRLRELDLRACGIATLDSQVFQNIPQLEALYLSDNAISMIHSNAFDGLPKLMHLDLSRNKGLDDHDNRKHLTIDSDNAFSGLRSLRSLDFSHTILNPRRITALRTVGKQLERLSLCNAGVFKLEPAFFSNTSLKILDLSGNHMILEIDDALSGLEDTLTVFYASEIGLTSFDIFENFKNLEILKLNNNEIVNVKAKTARSLRRLQAMDLRRNRLKNWSEPKFSHMISLKLLDLSRNTITIINEDMIRDLGNVSFLALSGNPIVCNCNGREFVELAARNEMYQKQNFVMPLVNFLMSGKFNFYRRPQDVSNMASIFNFHRGFIDVNNVIFNRRNMSGFVSDERQIELNSEGVFVLVDYERDAYSCLSLPEGNMVPFERLRPCKEVRTEVNYILKQGKSYLYALLAIPGILLPALFLGYTYRRNLRYFYIIMRNSAMLSMVNENKTNSDDTIFNYDVFVSYCNEDRPWVLDQLLSHLEKDCSVSLCLHERDFQVGLSILENIVSCMDRSKSIMLVISKQFLQSQWCQFEMHLAQHRLLETRREDLILILLEDIPRRLRPNTLHYLMLTKTYIVWPKNKSEQHLFWKRLKKSVTTQRQRENTISLA